jgi:hypothetical protein
MINQTLRDLMFSCAFVEMVNSRYWLNCPFLYIMYDIIIIIIIVIAYFVCVFIYKNRRNLFLIWLLVWNFRTLPPLLFFAQPNVPLPPFWWSATRERERERERESRESNLIRAVSQTSPFRASPPLFGEGGREPWIWEERHRRCCERIRRIHSGEEARWNS